ncbi:Zinc finger protein [Armadillidium vulgare]|nr:Zinc finger protein [Armadillidium vulgare]
MNSPWDFIKSLGIQFYNLHDEKLLQGEVACKVYSKVPCIVEENLDSLRNDFVCEEFGCNSQFNSVLELETHHRARHTHVCHTCKTIFPSFHLLDRHIDETHDAFFHIASQKKPMYVCLLESCPKVFASPMERKDHCISEHKFPHDFRYDLMFRKIRKPTQNNNNKNKKTKSKQAWKVNEKSKDLKELQEERMEICSESRSDALDIISIPDPIANQKRRVPKSISFGMGIPRGFIMKRERIGSQHWHQKNKPDGTKTHIDQISMNDMTEALQDMES